MIQELPEIIFYHWEILKYLTETEIPEIIVLPHKLLINQAVMIQWNHLYVKICEDASIILLSTATIRQDKTKSSSLVFVFSYLYMVNQWKLCTALISTWDNTLHKKWSFPLRILSVNITKSAGNSRIGHIY